MQFYKKIREIKCEDASEVFSKIYRRYNKKFLFESRDISHIYGRLSLIGVDPAFEVTGKNDQFKIRSLNMRGERYLKQIRDTELKEVCDSFERTGHDIHGVISKEDGDLEESQRTRRKNISQIIRLILHSFKVEEKGFIGLYGGFTYDFVRLFEDLPELIEDVEKLDDFRLEFYDSFVYFDHLKNEASVIVYRDIDKLVKTDSEFLARLIERGTSTTAKFKIENSKFELDEPEYEAMVEKARQLAKEGELFEVVFSNTLRADFQGDAFGLYQKYRDENPSPYLFYFDFGDEQLVGASPEMMVRCENGVVHMRPISGTAKRGRDPVENHENMVELLNSEKERAELDMLIDLGRNDLARICQPGIEISDYRFVEQYSKVMHTVAHLRGNLRPDLEAFDSLIACMNAGTLTGAPKVQAMIEIEKNEKSRRGYYGGSIGYLTLAGNMDTGIIIRTAHIRNGRLSFRVGATLLYDSDPTSEYEETLNKARAFLTTIGHE